VMTGMSGCGGAPSSSSPYVTGPITAACTVTAVFASTQAVPLFGGVWLWVLGVLASVVAGMRLLKRAGRDK
jgi:hypothetical protein